LQVFVVSVVNNAHASFTQALQQAVVPETLPEDGFCCHTRPTNEQGAEIGLWSGQDTPEQIVVPGSDESKWKACC
jgi:hypothetical protein